MIMMVNDFLRGIPYEVFCGLLIIEVVLSAICVSLLIRNIVIDKLWEFEEKKRNKLR